MKAPVLIAALILSLCSLGCSKEGGKAGLVPGTVAELAASPDFKLEHTTPSGVQCYVREITRETAATIPADSRDSHFLEKRKQPYLAVFVCNYRIVDMKEMHEGNHMLTAQQAGEMFAWGFKRSLEADGADKAQDAAAKRAGMVFQ